MQYAFICYDLQLILERMPPAPVGQAGGGHADAEADDTEEEAV